MTLDVLQQRPATSCGKASLYDGGSFTVSSSSGGSGGSGSVLVKKHKTTKHKHKSPMVGIHSSKNANDDIPERSDDDDDDDNGDDKTRVCMTTTASREAAAVTKFTRKLEPVADRTLQLTNMLRSEEAKLSQQLLIASETGNKHAAYLLLHQGLNVDRCKGMSGYSPLHYAATRGHLEVIQLLLDFGWPVDSTNDLLETPLHLAAYHGHVPAAECLLDRGADVNACNSDNETPLFYATRKSHYRVVRLLIRRECDLALANRFGDVAEDDAVHEKTRLEFSVGKEDAHRLCALRARRDKPNSGAVSVQPRVACIAADTPHASNEQRVSQTQREHILSFLDLKSLCLASQVSYRWHRAADNPALWRRLGVSRWELLLNATMGIGAVSTMGLGIGGLRLNLSSTSKAVSRRPASCEQSGSRFEAAAVSSIQRKSTLIAKQRAGEELRPQTARLCGSGY